MKRTCEEEVQEGTYHRDSTEFSNFLPAWRNSCRDYIGRELKRQGSDEPTPITQPDFAHQIGRWRGKDQAQAVEANFDRAHDNGEQREAIDHDDRVSRDEDQPFLHDKLRRDWPLTASTA